VLRYIVRCTSGSVLDRLQTKRIWVSSRLVYQLAEVGIDSLDIVVGDVASLPNSSITCQLAVSPHS
jgi:hypothetical protein